MLKAINTKSLLSILAAVLAIGGYLIHEHEEMKRAADAAARAAAILQQQQDGADAARKHDAETWEFVHKQRQKNDSSNVNGSKTWTTYLP